MASISSLMNQNMYAGLFKTSSAKYNTNFSNQMFGQQDMASRNDMMLQNILEKNASKYDKNMSSIYDYNAQSKPFFNEFNSKLGDLQESSAALKSYGSTSVFNSNSYGSSDNKVVTVKSGNLYGAKDMSIKVDQIATGQTSQTSAIDSKSIGKLSGPNSINITTGDGKNTKINVNLSPSMSSGDAMKEIAKSVNNSKAGVTATVVEKDGKSNLQFTATDTGKDATFKIDMSSKLQNALTPEVTTEAKDAAYSVDGKAYTSKTNNVTVGADKVNVTLKGAGEADLAKNKTNASQVVDAIKTFVSDINDSVKFLNDNRGKSSAVRGLANSLSSFKYRDSSFAQIGIEIKGNKMTVNEEKLTKALEQNPDRVKNLLGGTTGFAAEANKSVTSALQRQTQYMPPPQIRNNSTDFLNNYNPYSGTLFDVFA